MKKLLIVLFVFSSIPAWGAPVINGFSGTMGHGQNVTITGSGFGTKPSASPVLWDTVDNISCYSGLSEGATIPMGGSCPWPSPYGNSSGRNLVKMSKTDAQRGVSTAQYKASNRPDAYMDGLSWAATNYAYVSWWWKQDRDVAGGAHSSKWLRMSSASDEVNKTFSWTQQQAIIFSNPTYCANLWPSWGGNPNNWNFIEAWFNSGNRTFTIRVNGSTVTSGSWASCSSWSFNELWKIGFDGGGDSPPSITWWMDDIYVDNSFARVMIGNASTYGGSSHFEMQIPSSWSSTSISVKVNRGSFGATASAYLYVMDSSGAVNSNGYPIVFGDTGGGGGGTLLIPSPPANIHVE